MGQETIGLHAELAKICRCNSGYGAYHRIMTAPAISSPRNAGTNIGGTSHSRRLNFWIDILTASFFGRSSNSLSPIDAKGWTVMGRSRYSFPHNVELNLKKIGEPKTPRFRRNRVDTGSRSIHITKEPNRLFPISVYPVTIFTNGASLRRDTF